MTKVYRLQLSTGLIALSAIMFITGCTTNDAVRQRYEAQKKLHRAERTLEQAGMSPDAAETGVPENVLEAYSEAVDYSLAALDSVDREEHPVEYRDLQHVAVRGANQLARLFYSRKRFDEAIDQLARLLEENDLTRDQLLTTEINLGRGLQSSGRWDSALTIYTATIEEFYPPTDEHGEVRYTVFNLPVQIYRITEMIGDSARAADAFARAETYYTGLVEEYPETKAATAARANLARMYEAEGRWRDELQQLEALSDTTSEAYQAIRVRMGDIYARQLDQYRRAIDIYEELLADVDPQEDTVAYPLFRFKIARVRLDQGRYDEARSILTDLKEEYRHFYVQRPEAQLTLARSFELDNNWSRAEIEYTYLTQNYRGSDEAMAAFLYVGGKLEQMGRTNEAERWYQDGEEYYQQIAELGRGGPAEARAMGYLSQLEQRRGNWREAARILTDVFETFPQNEIGRRSLVRAAVIYRDRLGQPAVGDSLMDVLKTTVTDLDEPPQVQNF